jgi:putative FmdB family regulatory protein
MPRYDYECVCGESGEAQHGMEDRPQVLCPCCGLEMLKKIGIPAVQFKGNGFYETDYKKKSANDSEYRGGDQSPQSSATSRAFGE